MAAMAAMADGDRDRRQSSFGVAKPTAAPLAMRILLDMIMVVAARLGRGRPGGVVRALVADAQVARVRAAAEGEVRHRCDERDDDRDDANEGSHGGCLSAL